MTASPHNCRRTKGPEMQSRQVARRRVLFVISQLSYGGSEKQLALLAEGLRDTFDVGVLSLSNLIEPFGENLRAAGIAVRTPSSGHRLLRMCWAAREVWQDRSDVVVFFAIRNVAALLIGLCTRAKIIYTERSLGVWKSSLYRAIDRVLYLRCSLLVANSQATRSFIEANHPGQKGRVKVVYNGVAVPASRPVSLRGQAETVFCLVAGIRPWKGHAFLVEAVDMLAREGLQFRVILVGDGPEKPRIEEMVRSKGIERFFDFAGWQRDPGAFFDEAHVSLNVSSHESLSNAIMEGMARGCPSIVSRVGGNTELVEDGVDGLVVDYGDAAQLACAMRRLSGDRGLQRRLGERARQKMANGYSVESMIRQMGDMINGV